MPKAEIVQQCLNLAPVPCLSAAFALLKLIWDEVQLVWSYKYQLKELARSIAFLLSTLNDQFQRRTRLESSTLDSLCDLQYLLNDIVDWIAKQKSYGFFKLLFVKEDSQAAIDSYHQQITETFRRFQISALLDIQALQQENNRARENDREQLLERLRNMEVNQYVLIEEIRRNQNPMVTMAALQTRLNNKQGDEAELKFFSHSLEYIWRSTGLKLEYENWMITSLEVEFGPVISEGGFGIIHQGKWKGTDVALKVLKNTEGITPHEKDLRNEIRIWSTLRHPNVLQFLGASVFDRFPFIVMPLIYHGNVRDYLAKCPHCDRLKIIHKISVGIVYLHSKGVIHGDLKGANVLVDDGEKPLLCDFGLSRIKENVDSRSCNQASFSSRGSLNWMAPERLEGNSLRSPCDIYSFAMTMYEIYTDSTPLGGVLPADFREVVAVQRGRPEKPIGHEAPQLTEDGWKLITRCWAARPLDRPTADAVCAELARMKAAADVRVSNEARIAKEYYMLRDAQIEGREAGFQMGMREEMQGALITGREMGIHDRIREPELSMSMFPSPTISRDSDSSPSSPSSSSSSSSDGQQGALPLRSPTVVNAALLKLLQRGKLQGGLHGNSNTIQTTPSRSKTALIEQLEKAKNINLQGGQLLNMRPATSFVNSEAARQLLGKNGVNTNFQQGHPDTSNASKLAMARAKLELLQKSQGNGKSVQGRPSNINVTSRSLQVPLNESILKKVQSETGGTTGTFGMKMAKLDETMAKMDMKMATMEEKMDRTFGKS
ncbi:kinase-like protein [Pholiota conissans]|uniref:Kinase-like protein n=1 Tax=Pholiota conissans TaxID=109636 RepID=A0A9P5ZCI9_9AGAR|nr:kinase-like protein [Pholiota conissans]